MPNGKKWSFGVILATMAAFLLVIGAPALAQAGDDMPVEVKASGPADACDQPADSSTEGANGFTAPAPTKLDASGSGSDGICIPRDSFDHPQYGFGMYRVNGRSLGEGFHRVKEGVTSVSVTTEYDSGTWTFDFTNQNQGTEAKNRYWAELGECGVTTPGSTDVTFFARNVDDDSNLPINKLTVIPDRPSSPLPVTYKPEYAIQDGETREILIMDFQGGLYPGTWNFDVFIGDSEKRSARVVLWIPGCDGVKPPDGDQPPGVAAKPKASVRQLVCHPPRVKVTLNNRASDKPVAFRVLKNGVLVKSYRLKAGEMKRVIQKAKPRSKVKVMAAGKGLAIKRIKPYRHC